MKKGNEDLKAKIAKIQQKGKAASPAPALEVPTPTPALDIENDPNIEDVTPGEDEGDDMKALEAEFEAKKKALMQKKVPVKAPEPEQPAQNAFDEMLSEYQDEGKFRVELIFQLVKLNEFQRDIAISTKEIATALKSLTNNG